MGDTYTGTEGRDVVSGYYKDMSGRGGNDDLTGSAIFCVIHGGEGNDTLVHAYGPGGEAKIYGEDGNDRIRGGGSDDKLYGGRGDDLIKGGDGIDKIYGGAGDDRLRGQDGNDVLSGGRGFDILTGGSGTDAFVFDARLDPDANVDTITDFATNFLLGDVIYLDDKIFDALKGQTGVTADQFHVGRRAGDAEDRIIYNARTGDLFYDANGSDSGQKVLFARLDAHLAIDEGHFVVF